MIIHTSRFGKITIEEEDIIQMPSGLLGFSGDHHFVLLDDEIGSPFKWFQSVEQPKLAFVTIDPLVAVSDYSLSISNEHLHKLSAIGVDELRVMVIVTMTRELNDVTINLQGPLIINPKKRLGLQLVITEGPYSTRHPLFGDKLQITAEKVNSNADEERQVAVG